jgi:hypothetical protein
MRIESVTVRGDRGRITKLTTTDVQNGRWFTIKVEAVNYEASTFDLYVNNADADEFTRGVARLQEQCDGFRGCSGDRSPYVDLLSRMIER